MTRRPMAAPPASRAVRWAYRLAILAAVLLVLLAWTSIPDCWQPGVCG